MTRKRMIHSLEFKRGKTIDYGLVPMTKEEMKVFDDADKRKKAGKEIMYSFDPISLMSSLAIHVKKDRLGNVHVDIRRPKKGECHHYRCTKKTPKNYVLCTKHLKLRKKK